MGLICRPETSVLHCVTSQKSADLSCIAKQVSIRHLLLYRPVLLFLPQHTVLFCSQVLQEGQKSDSRTGEAYRFSASRHVSLSHSHVHKAPPLSLIVDHKMPVDDLRPIYLKSKLTVSPPPHLRLSIPISLFIRFSHQYPVSMCSPPHPQNYILFLIRSTH